MKKVPLIPHSPHIQAIRLSVSCFILFLGVAAAVTLDLTQKIDERLLRFIDTIAPDASVNFFILVTAFGGAMFVAMAACIWAILLLKHRRTTHAFFVVVGVGGAAVLSMWLKLVFERPRPELWEWSVTETSFAFPSTHAIASSALALAIIYLAWRTSWRWRMVVIGSIYALSIGLSRLVLGVHYPSDVIGGWLISVIWISATWVITAKTWPKITERQSIKNLR